MYQKFSSLQLCDKSKCTPKTQDIIQQAKSRQDKTIPTGVAHSSLPLSGVRDKGCHKAKGRFFRDECMKTDPQSWRGEFIPFTLRWQAADLGCRAAGWGSDIGE